MQQLSQAAFEKARQYIYHNARPLDQALFAYRFENGLPETLLDQLANYQNDDGGFGHALEPDLRTPKSSALATRIALHLFEELNLGPDHPMVSSTIQYLRDTYDPIHKVWRIIPSEANKHPHAPWWLDREGSLERTFDDFLIIPRADLVRALHHYSAQVPADWLTDVTEEAVASILSIPELGTGGGDDLVHALSLAETETLPKAYKDRLAERLRRVIPDAVNTDPGAWKTYSIHPLKVAPHPRSLAAPLVWEGVQHNLDYLVASQTDQGCWEPNWSWGDFYPEMWETAKKEWSGHLTVENLTILKSYGRIAS